MEETTEENRTNLKIQYLVAISASLATVTSGTVLGWTSQIPHKLNQTEHFPISDDDLGWINSSSSLGAAFLSLLIGPICDQFGRKLIMLIMCVFMEIGWCLIIFSETLWLLIAGRFVTGMIGGSYCVTVSLYINEISQKSIRGQLGCLTQLMIVVGILFSNIAGFLLSIRQFSIACTVPPIIFFSTFLWMPETPTFFLIKSKTIEAKNSLIKLRGQNYDNIDKEIEDIQNELLCSNTHNTESIRNCLRKSSTKKALYISLGMVIFRIFCGIDAVTCYLNIILKKSNTIKAEFGTSIFTVVQLISVFVQSFFIDKYGRRILLIISEFIISISLFAIAGILLSESQTFMGYILLILICLYAVAFSLGIGPIGWIICTEIFPVEIKAYAMSGCTFLVWLLAFVSVKVFLTIGSKDRMYIGFFIYGFISLIGAFVIFFFVPETRNKTYKEIEKDLS